RGGELGQCVFGKCIVQKSHQIGDTYYMRHGYWRHVRQELGVQPLPAIKSEFIQQFCKDFGINRKDGQLGTSWVIPFPVESLTQEAMIRAVLVDFHFSVLKGALEVDVFGVEINQDTISDLIAKHLS